MPPSDEQTPEPYVQQVVELALKVCFKNIRDLSSVYDMANRGAWEPLPADVIEKPGDQQTEVAGWAAPLDGFRAAITIDRWQGEAGKGMNTCAVHGKSEAAGLLPLLEKQLTLQARDNAPGKVVYIVTGSPGVILELETSLHPVATAIRFIWLHDPPSR
jgi:hypothetical protein